MAHRKGRSSHCRLQLRKLPRNNDANRIHVCCIAISTLIISILTEGNKCTAFSISREDTETSVGNFITDIPIPPFNNTIDPIGNVEDKQILPENSFNRPSNDFDREDKASSNEFNNNWMLEKRRIGFRVPNILNVYDGDDQMSAFASDVFGQRKRRRIGFKVPNILRVHDDDPAGAFASMDVFGQRKRRRIGFKVPNIIRIREDDDHLVGL